MRFVTFAGAVWAGFAVFASPITAQQVTTPEGGGVVYQNNESDEDAERSFAYSFPAEVAAIPALAKLVRDREQEALTKQQTEWREALAEFGKMGCVACTARDYSNSWSVAGQTPRFTLLLSERFLYTGGAHGNVFFDALGWDKEANEGEGKAFRPVDMFLNETALENTAYGDYCQALLEQKGERLDMNIDDVSPFDSCPSVSELVVIPLSSNGQTFDRIQFLAAPYVAGSYAEGPYTFEIAVTASLLSVVEPQYQEHFTLGEVGAQ
ncbi:MAG: hypothetical protein ABJ205_03975 [Erythrobacter sp.]|uniref:hypothetical protein n=1 Tax=Erythrobacter sp. TaxID=1042 RepID=UPI0032673C07